MVNTAVWVGKGLLWSTGIQQRFSHILESQDCLHRAESWVCVWGSLQDAGIGSGPSVSGNCVGCGMLRGRSACSEVFPIGSYRNSSGGIW